MRNFAKKGQALMQKGAQRSETETARLAVVQASHAIYIVFLHKITPTALQAEMEQRGQRERARRQEGSHSLHEHLLTETKLQAHGE